MCGKRGLDHAIAEIARRQGGVISRQQLMGLRCSRGEIDYRVRIGRLHVVRRGVYAVGHRVLGATGRRWAAVLAYAPGAALSHAASGAAHGFRRSAASVIDVTVVGTGAGQRPESGCIGARRSRPTRSRRSTGWHAGADRGARALPGGDARSELEEIIGALCAERGILAALGSGFA